MDNIAKVLRKICKKVMTGSKMAKNMDAITNHCDSKKRVIYSYAKIIETLAL